MKTATEILIGRLQDLRWFSHVGEEIKAAKVRLVFSWKEAIKICKNKDYQNILIEMRNILSEKLCFSFRERFRLWNGLASELRPIIVKILEKSNIPLIIKEKKLPKVFIDSVRWDISAACMELEYADCVPSRFFTEKMEWYLAGHFPCGWEGDFPQGGRLIVF